MAAPLVTPADIEPYWRPLSPAETIVATALIMVASILIRRRIPDIDARITAGTLDIEIVRYVIAEMIKSAVEAPSRPVDAKSMSETAGPYARAFTFAAAASRVALTDDLLGMLGGTVSTEIGSLQLGPARIPCVTHSLYNQRHWPSWR